MDVTLWWIRHGPTHAQGMVGWTDLPADLSDHAALERLSAHLPEAAPVVASDLARARDTAAAIARGRPRLPDDPSLREMHFGRWELLRHAELEASDPLLASAFWERPDEVCPPGGERWDEMAARVSAAADRLARGGAADVIVVAHFGAILSQVQRALGVPVVDVLAQPVTPLSVTRLAFDGGWRLLSVNHLA